MIRSSLLLCIFLLSVVPFSFSNNLLNYNEDLSKDINAALDGALINNAIGQTKQCGCGVPGPRGPRGAQGVTGPVGDTGPQGQGAAGSTLAAGIYEISFISSHSNMYSKGTNGQFINVAQANAAGIPVSPIFDTALHVVATFHLNDVNDGINPPTCSTPAPCGWSGNQTLLFQVGMLRNYNGVTTYHGGYNVAFATTEPPTTLGLDGNWRQATVQILEANITALTTVTYTPVVSIYQPPFNSVNGLFTATGKVTIGTYGAFIGIGDF